MAKKVSVISTVGLGVPQDYDVEDHERVKDLVTKVARSNAIDPSAIQLVRNGETMDAGRSLKELKNGETLKAMPANPVQG